MRPLRVAVLTESATDDAVARAIVAHVRGGPVESVPLAALRTRGASALRLVLPRVVRAVYFEARADALVVLADTDSTAPHDPRTHAAGTPVPSCRWCELDAALRDALADLPPAGDRRLRTALGCPVPALEAWLLAHDTVRPSEAAWLQRGRRAVAGDVAYKRDLKRRAYGTDAPGREAEPAAVALIRHALAIPNLLRTAFPGGYAPLEDAIRAW